MAGAASPKACSLLRDGIRRSTRGLGQMSPDPSLPVPLHDIKINFERGLSCVSCLLPSSTCEGHGTVAEPLLDRDPKEFNACSVALPEPAVWPWGSHLASLDFPIYKNASVGWWLCMFLLKLHDYTVPCEQSNPSNIVGGGVGKKAKTTPPRSKSLLKGSSHTTWGWGDGWG